MLLEKEDKIMKITLEQIKDLDLYIGGYKKLANYIRDNNIKEPFDCKIIKESNDVDDFLWVMCHEQFIDAKTLRLFAVWCAREVLKLIKNPDPRSIKACDVTEKFANGKATQEELNIAKDAAWDAAWTAGADAARAATARVAARAAIGAARAAGADAARAARAAGAEKEKQFKKLCEMADL